MRHRLDRQVLELTTSGRRAREAKTLGRKNVAAGIRKPNRNPKFCRGGAARRAGPYAGRARRAGHRDVPSSKGAVLQERYKLDKVDLFKNARHSTRKKLEKKQRLELFDGLWNGSKIDGTPQSLEPGAAALVSRT